MELEIKFYYYVHYTAIKSNNKSFIMHSCGASVPAIKKTIYKKLTTPVAAVQDQSVSVWE
jgi:SET domain-containing protein